MGRNCLHILHKFVIRTECPRKQEYVHSLWTCDPDHDLRLFITTYHLIDYSGSCQEACHVYLYIQNYFQPNVNYFVKG